MDEDNQAPSINIDSQVETEASTDSSRSENQMGTHLQRYYLIELDTIQVLLNGVELNRRQFDYIINLISFSK
jgi:hypothetical protein